MLGISQGISWFKISVKTASCLHRLLRTSYHVLFWWLAGVDIYHWLSPGRSCCIAISCATDQRNYNKITNQAEETLAFTGAYRGVPHLRGLYTNRRSRRVSSILARILSRWRACDTFNHAKYLRRTCSNSYDTRGTPSSGNVCNICVTQPNTMRYSFPYLQRDSTAISNYTQRTSKVRINHYLWIFRCYDFASESWLPHLSGRRRGDNAGHYGPARCFCLWDFKQNCLLSYAQLCGMCSFKPGIE